MKKITNILFLLMSISLFNVSAEIQIPFKNIDNKLGLSQNGVQAIFQDKDGYMWFGTHYGLNCFDGITIKSFYKGHSKNELCGNDILQILQDSVGNIWIGSIEGITVYNPVTKVFYNLSKYAQTDNIFSHTIQSLKLINREIFISSNAGLWKINPGKELITDKIAISLCDQIKNCKIQPVLALQAIKVYFRDENDNYWITVNNHVIKSKIVNNKLLVIDNIQVDVTTENEITTLFKDNLSNIWVGTSNSGLYKIVENKGKYNSVRIYPNKVNSNSFSRITDIVQDNVADLWVSSRSDGIIIIPKNELTKTEINPRKLSESTLSTSKIKSIFLSHDNTLWLGTLGKGVFYYNNFGLKFSNHQLSDKLNNPSVNYTRTISKDVYNRLWIGTLFEGLHIYDTSIRQVSKSLLLNNSVFAIQPLDNTHMLAGSSDGLYLITYTKNNFRAEKLNLNSSTPEVIFSICNKDSRFWIGTDKGLLGLNLSADYKITKLEHLNNKLIDNLKYQNTIRCVKYDAKRNCLWIGGENSGLVQAKLDNQSRIIRFISFKETYKILSQINYICDIFIDNDNCWIGTRSGLVELKNVPSSNTFDVRIFTTNNGLPSNLIQSISGDNRENLWLGTIRGLVKFNKKTQMAINYDINDGIQDYEFSEHASYVDTNDTFYFGGINGVSEFTPDKKKAYNYSNPVRIYDLIINGVNVNNKRLGVENGILNLRNFENNIKFIFVSPNFINPLKCKYAFKLEGYDKDWIITTAEIRTAEYSNLPKGNYVFKVRSTDDNGIWDTGYSTFEFKIEPSFWVSFPGFMLYLVILILLIYFVSLVTKIQIKKKHDKLMEKQYFEQIVQINQSKLQFFINISHEIRTPLTLIVCSLENLISKLTLSNELKNETTNIERNVNRMLRLTNELLDIRKIETGNYQLSLRRTDIVSFTRNIVLTFESLAKQQEMSLIFAATMNELTMWLDENALEKSLCNLISNAIKYTKRKGNIEVDVSFSADNEYVEISVADSGIGIETDKLSRIFNRFYQLGGNSDSYEKGFGIGLSLTKNLIELHKGTIMVNSEVNKGSVFKISLPLNEDVYSATEKADHVLWKSDINTTLFGIETFSDDNAKIELPDDKIDPEKSTILYVDDNTELLFNISNYLSDDYNVITATNGRVGVEKANLYQPDVIISDIVMPEMDGFELCGLIKNDLNTSHIPVILLTARGDADSQHIGMEIGADYFIPKPFNVKLLTLTIKNLIQAREKLRNIFVSNKYETVQEVTTNTKDAQFIDKLLKYVEEHIGEDDLNIQVVADTLAMSRSTFFRKIKSITGMTGKDFIDAVRLKKAAKLLIESDLNISEIAYDIGHSNPQYFSKWFKAYYKMSPTEYIATHKKKEGL